jgi:glucosamine--fructose-6-phosphate aminotransferase (isomerizing)
MCGIAGYVGQQEAVPILVDCLKRLEYRGYDSAGLGVVADDVLHIRRSVGKIAHLEQLLLKDPASGTVGVAHTRWATHGKPSDENAHPHTDCSGSLAVVHNGIIENYLDLRADLEAEGHVFKSETDTEVVAHLIERAFDGHLETATARAVAELRGAFALGIVSRHVPGVVLAVRRGGPPLVVGSGRDGTLLASDIPAVLPHARDLLVLEDGEMAVLSGEKAKIITIDGRPVHRTMSPIPWAAAATEKNGYPHFMLKEIHEQPRAVRETLRELVDDRTWEIRSSETRVSRPALGQTSRILIVACGTSWHAGLVGKHMLETLCRVPVEVDVASEFRYRNPIVDAATLTLAISQSGETADTLAALREARSRGSKSVAICNVAESSLGREADGVIHTRAGPEVGVASTKTFTSQLVALYLFSVHLGRIRGTLSSTDAEARVQELRAIPLMIESALGQEAEVKELARLLHGFRDFLYLGRGINHPLALEGALKLKELSYIHAEGYPAGEMKHGPIALIDRATPVVVLAPRDHLYEKTRASIQEIKARDGIIVALASEGDTGIAAVADHVIRIPRATELLQPLLLAIPLQLLAYYVAVERHCDVDQPRNLAKSVTVE